VLKQDKTLSPLSFTIHKIVNYELA
jgi:hypothetical protein